MIEKIDDREGKEIQWYRNAGNRGPITLPFVF